MGKGIIKKWIKGICTKPLVILKGIWHNINNDNIDLASDRLDICYKCDYCIYYKGALVCEECGCILKNKTRIKDEKCIMNKW